VRPLLRRLRSGVLAVVRLRPRRDLLDDPRYAELIRRDLARRAREVQAEAARRHDLVVGRAWSRRVRAEVEALLSPPAKIADRAVVSDGYAQGRADLQLVHAAGWVPCTLGTITVTRPPIGSTRVRFHAEPRGLVEGWLLGLAPSDVSLVYYRIEVGTVDGPREYDLPLSHSIEVLR